MSIDLLIWHRLCPDDDEDSKSRIVTCFPHPVFWCNFIVTIVYSITSFPHAKVYIYCFGMLFH